MVTKLDARVLNIDSDLRTNSSGELGMSRDGWYSFEIPSGASSISIPLDPDFEEFEYSMQEILVTVNGTASTLKFDYGAGPITTGTHRRYVSGYGSSGFSSKITSNDGVILWGINSDNIGLKMMRGHITNRVNKPKNIMVVQFYNDSTYDYLVTYAGMDPTQARAQAVVFTVASGTIRSGTIRIRPIKKV